MKKRRMLLKGYGNPDYGQYADVAPTLKVEHEGDDWLEKFKKDVIWYRMEFDLGGGNWGRLTGVVFTVDYDTLDVEYEGRFSYNGRFWPSGSDDYEPTEDELAEAARKVIDSRTPSLQKVKKERERAFAEFMSRV